MSLITDTIAQLKPDGSPFKIVEGATEFADIDKTPNAWPAAYVFFKEEASAENERATDQVLQRTEADLAVVFCVKNMRRKSGGPAVDALEEHKNYVRGQLLGFEPASAGEPLEHVSGQLITARHGYVWWEELFAAAYYQESTQ